MPLYLSSSGSALICAPKWMHFPVFHIILNINLCAHFWQNFSSLHVAFVFLLICMHLSDKEPGLCEGALCIYTRDNEGSQFVNIGNSRSAESLLREQCRLICNQTGFSVLIALNAIKAVAGYQSQLQTLLPA